MPTNKPSGASLSPSPVPPLSSSPASCGSAQDVPGVEGGVEHEVEPHASVRPIPGKLYATDANGWTSPFPFGDPRCPLTGEFSEMGRGRMSPWDFVVMALLLVLGGAVGAGAWVALAVYTSGP